MSTNKNYDLLVIGAGVNGLVAATIAAKKGKKVLIVEKRPEAGGLAASYEFVSGFKSPGILHDTTALRPWVVEQLDLKKHGLKIRAEEAPIYAPEKNGKGLLLWRDPQRAAEEISPRSAKDAAKYKEYRAFLSTITPFLGRVFDEFPPEIATMSFPGMWELMKKAVSLRLLGKDDMMEILRIAPMCVADWLNEWFENDLLKACLAGPSIYNSYTGPWSPGTNANLLLAEAFCYKPVVGGPQALVTALLSAAKAAGVELRLNTEVESLALAKVDEVDGVTLKGGETIKATAVAAAIDPKQLFLKLMPPANLTHNFEHNIVNIRARGTTAKVTLALNGLPQWNQRPSLKAEYIRTGEYFDQMERAFDAVKYRKMSDEPLLDIYIPTLEAPEMAPNGKHVMSVLVHFAPHQLDAGWSAEMNAELLKRTLKALDQYAPGASALVAGSEVLSPVDLEKRFNLSGGHLFHGEHAADQLLVRPTPECSRYSTPFKSLFLIGGGAHPGGGITGAPGALAAKMVLG